MTRLDFSNDFEIVGKIAKYYEGALSISSLMKAGRRNLYFWFDIYILQATEDEIVQELLEKKKNIPAPDKLRKMVNERIESRKNV